MRHVSLGHYHVLAAAEALTDFTVDSLSRHAGITPAAAYKLLRRSPDRIYFEQIDSIPQSRGRPLKRFRIRPDQVSALRQRLAGLRTAMDRISASTAQADTATADVQPELSPSLLAAEYALIDRIVETNDYKSRMAIAVQARDDLEKDRELKISNDANLVIDAHRRMAWSLLELCELEDYAFLNAPLDVQTCHYIFADSLEQLLANLLSSLLDLDAETRQDVLTRVARSPLADAIRSIDRASWRFRPESMEAQPRARKAPQASARPGRSAALPVVPSSGLADVSAAAAAGAPTGARSSRSSRSRTAGE